MSDDSTLTETVRRQAETWAMKVGRPPLSHSDLRAFRAWIAEPEHRSVRKALEAAGSRPGRYVRPHTGRYRIVDIWTGETATIAMSPQEDLSEADASHTASLPNARAAANSREAAQVAVDSGVHAAYEAGT